MVFDSSKKISTPLWVTSSLRMLAPETCTPQTITMMEMIFLEICEQNRCLNTVLVVYDGRFSLRHFVQEFSLLKRHRTGVDYDDRGMFWVCPQIERSGTLFTKPDDGRNVDSGDQSMKTSNDTTSFAGGRGCVNPVRLTYWRPRGPCKLWLTIISNKFQW